MSIADLIEGVKKAHKAGERWELEVGEPFYEPPIQKIVEPGKEGAEIMTFFRSYAEDGTQLYGPWDTYRPARLSHERERVFKSTPNAVLLGKDGTILVSRGRFGLRERREGEREYVAYDEWYAWRDDMLREADRTIANRPVWAESIMPIAAWGTVDYILEIGPAKFKQRLEKNGDMSPAWGSIDATFQTPDELREVARAAIELADRLDVAL